jgi:CRP/FNR family transcriptional regulator, dissimilatory nitrate respiration regulator
MGVRRLDVVSFLSNQSLFRDLAASALARLASGSVIRRLPRGADLFEAGQPSEGLYLIIEGQIKLFAKADNGHQKVIEVVGAGECISESLMFSDEHHSVNASVLFDAQVLVIPKDVLLQELEHNAGLAMRMLMDMSRRFNGLVRDIQAVTLHSGAKRVVDYLLQSPSPAKESRANQPSTISLPASKGTIASLLSVTPEHFSRILHELQANGLISVQRRQIHILDAQGLAQYA